MNLKKIAVLTGTRAEYGLLKTLLKKLNKSEYIELQLIVSGMHLSPEFGNTVNEIEQDGLPIAKKIEILLSGDSPVSINKSIGLGFISYAEVFAELNPDIALLLGDRYEALAFAQSAVISRVPVAHIHGGEATHGLIDEPIRHAITKFSSLHFASTETYRKRLIQLGEQPATVFNVGALGVDNIKSVPLYSKEKLENELSISLDGLIFMVTYHPVTLENNSTEVQFQQLLQALEQYEDAVVIFTYANSDTDGRVINQMIEAWIKDKPNVYAKTSLGLVRYLSFLQFCDAVIGNSSSGIIEAPSFGVPTVNIGDRQGGRVRANSVIDCNTSEDSIASAIKKALSDEMNTKCKKTVNPYEQENTSQKIYELLRTEKLRLKKKFYDL